MTSGAVVALVLGPLAPAPLPAHLVARSVLAADGPACRYRYDGQRLAVRASGSGEPNRRELVVPGGSGR